MRSATKLIFLLLSPALAFALNGCGTSNGDFTLAALPSTPAITAGTNGQISVVASAVSGFNSPVSVTLTGLPSGISAAPATLMLTPGAPQAITLNTTTSAAVGNATVTLTGTAGTLTHTATATVAIGAAPPPPPPPDFSLAVSPSMQTAMLGSSGAQVTVLATAVNGFTGPVAVTASGLPTGVTTSPATLNLTPGSSQGLSLIAGPTAMPGMANVTLTGVSGSITHTTTLALTVDPASSPTMMTADVTTWHNNNARDGLYSQETTLTPANVNSASFGLLGIYSVDGKVDAQPLFVGNLKLQTGTETHTVNVVYVATEHDSIYALNAATGAQEWKTSLIPAGETTSDPRNCNQIVPEIGITATPVIDRAYGTNGAIFAVAMTKDGSGTYHHRLHALDLTTGAELPGSPTEIAATFAGSGVTSINGKVTFDPAQYEERASLLLLNGTIYTAWSSHCDIAPYQGWVMGYNEATLKQSTVLNLTPNGSDGSIWMSGAGLAADSTGSIFLLDANGTLDSGFTPNGFPSRGDFGDSMLKLNTAAGLAVADYFEPYNSVMLSSTDKDMGSGGAMLLPDLTDASGTVRHLVVGAGKDSNLYVGNRDNLGKFNSNSSDNSNLYQEIPMAFPNEVYATAAYFHNTIYIAGVNDVLRAYTITNAKLGATSSSQSATSFAYPGSTPAVSANGLQNGIVWALESAENAPAVLHAYDAANLAHELYNSNQAGNGRDLFGKGNKFITPVIANGDVFVGTPNGVAVFGTLTK